MPRVRPLLFASATGASRTTEVGLASKPAFAPMPEAPPPNRRKRKGLTVVAVAIIMIAATILAVRHNLGQRQKTGQETAQTTVVVQKDFVRTIRVNGTVEAIESHMIAAPRLSGQGLSTLTIIKLVRTGSSVHRGDVLVEFDRQAQLKNVLDKQADYRDLVAQISQKNAEQAATLAADETELKKAEDAEKTAQLEVKKNEIVSRIDAEKNQQDLEEATATLQQLKQTFELKRRAARAELKILEIQRDRALTAMRWAQGNTEKMVIHSPIDGVAVINVIWKGTPSEIQEGDSIRAGLSIMQVVDPSRMQVRSRVNQADIEGLKEGQSVHIGLDAYPDLSFSGKVENLAAVAQPSSFSNKMRILNVIFSINGSAPNLLPDLSASVDIELDHQNNALVLPRDAVFLENGRSYVQVKDGAGYLKREVKLGPVNDLEQVVLSGVDAGTVVLRGSSS